MFNYMPLTKQPFSLYFLFKTDRLELPSPPEAIMAEPGSIEARITVNGIVYGPYNTGINTAFGHYVDWRRLQATEESKTVTQEISKFIELVCEAHTQLEQREGVMDDPQLMKVVNLLRGTMSN